MTTISVLSATRDGGAGAEVGRGGLEAPVSSRAFIELIAVRIL
jgi:hypothetical protein